MAREVIAAFYIDPLPAHVLSGLVWPGLAAAVIICRPDVTTAERAAALRAVRAVAGTVYHSHHYSPAPGVCSLAVFATGDPYLAAAAMVRSLGSSMAVARCPTDLVPDEQFGLDHLIDRIYQAWYSRQLPAPAPAWRLVAPEPLLLAG